MGTARRDGAPALPSVTRPDRLLGSRAAPAHATALHTSPDPPPDRPPDSRPRQSFPAGVAAHQAITGSGTTVSGIRGGPSGSCQTCVVTRPTFAVSGFGRWWSRTLQRVRTTGPGVPEAGLRWGAVREESIVAVVDIPRNVVDGFLAGNEAALNEVMRLLWPAMVRFCFRLGASVEDAKEIANDVLYELFRKRAKLRPERFVGAVFKTCRFRSYDRTRNPTRHRQRPSQASGAKKKSDEMGDSTAEQGGSVPTSSAAARVNTDEREEEVREVPLDEDLLEHQLGDDLWSRIRREEDQVIEEIENTRALKEAIREAADRDMLRFTQLCFPESKRELIRAVLMGTHSRDIRDLLPEKDGSARSVLSRLRQALLEFAQGLPKMHVPGDVPHRYSYNLLREYLYGGDAGVPVTKAVLFFLPVRIQPVFRELLRDPNASDPDMSEALEMDPQEIAAARKQIAHLLKTLGNLVNNSRAREEFAALIQEVLGGH